MRHTLLAVTILALSACSTRIEPAPSPQTINTPDPVETSISEPDMTIDSYAEGWDLSRGWPGEYPPGFSVLTEGVTLIGRSVMQPLAEADTPCPLPKFATYQPWNDERAEADELDFRTATKLFDITMTTNAPIEVLADALGTSSKLLHLKTGDVLVYKRYLGEGFAIIAHDGVDYEINEVELSDISDFAEKSIAIGYQEDLWVNVKCASEQESRAWILYDEARQNSGIGPTPIFGFGDSRDITGFDLPDIRQQIEMEEEFGF
ncbi:MAG: hypothetical protein Hens3KO_25650 [Henriciella sp.]